MRMAYTYCKSWTGALPAVLGMLLCTVPGLHAKVILPSLFTDGLVLQDYYRYDSRSFIYGLADVNETVYVNTTLAITGNLTEYSTIASGGDGSWIIQLNPDYYMMEGVQQMAITVCGSSDGCADITTIRNVSYGDVFIVRAMFFLPLSCLSCHHITSSCVYLCSVWEMPAWPCPLGWHSMG